MRLSGLGSLTVLLLVLATGAAAEETGLPPGERPVTVHAGFFLLNLTSVSERDETFSADLYLTFRWHDSRLAFTGTKPRQFVEEAAVARLGEIWWPAFEFVNVTAPVITNRALEIAPDGAVHYHLGVSGDFRADLDLRRFPFDQQVLEVRVQSFLWDENDVVFVADPTRVGFTRESSFEGQLVTHVDSVARRSKLADWDAVFSEFVVRLDVERQTMFYLWTVFAPVALIFLISCTVFVVPFDQVQDRVGIGLAALLACIATQFAISFDLPQIAYLTVIDRLFLATYACIALAVLVSTLEVAWLRGDAARAARVDRIAGLALPALYIVLVALCIRG